MWHRVGRWLAPMIVLALGNPPVRGDEPGPVSPAGTVRLATGPMVEYVYHSNRNALGDVLPAGDALIAQTDPGHLLRFDRAALGLTLERSGPSPATCLGRGEGGAVLAGFADGRVGRVDPASLAITELARLPGTVRWVGDTAAGAGKTTKPRLVAVVEQKKWDKDDEGERFEVPFSVVHDLDSGKTYTIEPRSEYPPDLRATAFLLDSKRRLWLGGDNGEWGGWCSYVDLDAGHVRSVAGQKIFDHTPERLWPGVFGFTELHDKQVWAYGGTTHMGSTEGFIWRVDRGKSEELYRLDNGPLIRREMEKMRKAAGIDGPAAKVAPRPEPPFPADRPCVPIAHVVEDPTTGAVAVAAFSNIYLTDARLARWQKTHELTIRYDWGRPDAVGAYPSVRSVLPIEAPGKPMGLILATRFNGLIRLADGKETGYRPLGAESVERIADSSEGILVFDGSEEGEIWRCRDGSWSPVSFAPPYQPLPDGPEAPGKFRDNDWDATCILIGRDRSIFTVSASSAAHKGTRTTARLRDGKPAILGREVSALIPSECFSTPDGQLWNADHRTLRRFVDGRWVEVSLTERPRRVRRADLWGHEWQLETVNEAGPPWIVHDRHYQLLLRLDYRAGFKDPRLEVAPSAEGGRDLHVRDAISWTEGELLLATDRGLRTFAIDGGKLSTPPLNTGGRAVSHLVRDGRRRLWLGGEGLAVLEADGKTIHPLDELPMLGRSKIDAITADPAHPDGAIAAIEDRGVVFLRVGAR